MTIYCLFNTWFTVHMTTSRYITIAYRIQAYSTLKLSLEFLRVYFKVDVVLLLFVYHFCFCFCKIKKGPFIKIYKQIKEL